MYEKHENVDFTIGLKPFCMKSLPVQISADGCFCCFYKRFLMILAFERCDDVCMKNMKMLILQQVFNEFGENHAAGNRQPRHRPGVLGARKRQTQREPFALAFGKNVTSLSLLPNYS